MPMPSRSFWFPFQTPSRRRHTDREMRHEAEVAALKAELARVRQASAEAQRARHACLTRTTHELRTPLNAVIGYSQLLREEALTERQASRIAIIEQAGQHMLTLVDEILALSCIEAGSFGLHAAPLVLAPFLAQVLDLMRPQAMQKGLVLRLDAARLPDTVQADAQRLRQVLLNLLANAVRFTDQGEVTLRAWAAPGPVGTARLHFEVADTGVGIEPQELRSLFQPYRQIGDPARRGGGTGLGLTISRQLVRAMGGEIDVHSTPGQGSCFGFALELPLHEPAAQPA